MALGSGSGLGLGLGSTKVITSKDHPLLLRLRKRLGHPGAYRKQGDVLIEGEHLCAAYLQHAGAVPTHAIVSESGWALVTLRNLALAAGAVVVVPDKLMASISGLDSPETIAFLVPLGSGGGPLQAVPTVVLDRLQDPGNVGTVLRTAAAFGFHQVLALKGTAALWSSKVLRSAMGAHFGLRLVEGLELVELTGLGLPLLATSPHAKCAVHETKLPWPCAWVMGNEGQGVSDALAQQCAQAFRIAQPGGQESLNVAAAAAVCLYESVRQQAMQ
jgi:RNA methyltransferase, TrmH family